MLADKLRAVIGSAGSEESVADLYASDALLDANVPLWRFQRKGVDDIRAQFHDWYGEAPASVEQMRELEADWGSVIEYQERGIYDGRPAYSRTLSMLFVEDGKVVKHVFYCTGPWDAETEGRQKVEAPMYEP